MNVLYTIFCGMCMGAADIVPGISGGTIAFIMGFYDQLIDGIKNFSFRNFSRNKFLLALITGISISLISLVRFFDFILGHEAYRVFLYAGFLGLILASVVICAKEVEKWSKGAIIGFIVGCGLAFLLTGTMLQVENKEALYDLQLELPKQEKKLVNYDYQSQILKNVPESTVAAMLSKGIVRSETIAFRNGEKGIVGNLFKPTFFASYIDPWIIFCGAIAISAMLLPGISGSYLLTIFGVYPLVIGSLADVVQAAKGWTLDVDGVVLLSNLLVGIIIGALVFSRVISWLLHRHKDVSIALLTGFMIGAMQSVWPFWTYAYAINPLKLDKGAQLQVLEPILPEVSLDLGLSFVAVITGFALVFLVEYLAKRKPQTTRI